MQQAQAQNNVYPPSQAIQASQSSQSSQLQQDPRVAVPADTRVRQPALIIMDQVMPIMGGVEATRRIRALGCKIPIVALTGMAYALGYACRCWLGSVVVSTSYSCLCAVVVMLLHPYFPSTFHLYPSAAAACACVFSSQLFLWL